MNAEQIELAQWLEEAGKSRGIAWPKRPLFDRAQHRVDKARGQTDVLWQQGTPWRWDGYRLCIHLTYHTWGLQLLAAFPPESMALLSRDMADNWIVRVMVEGEQVTHTDPVPGIALAQALRALLGK